MTIQKKKDDLMEGMTGEIPDILRNKLELCVIGDSPLLMNRFAMKALQEILQPSLKKNKADKQSGPKHFPLQEFKSAAHILKDEGPTYLAMPSLCFKGAIRNAALDIPGMTKAQIGRLTWVEGEHVPIWGIPQMHLGIVRNSDPGHTPDVRTRPILRRWAAKLTISYVAPLLQPKPILALLQAGGIFIGVGDFRAQKGLGNFGQFRMVAPSDSEFKDIVKNGGRKAQIAAMMNPTFYDEQSEELYNWYVKEINRRGFDKVKPPSTQGILAGSENGVGSESEEAIQ